MKNNDTRKAIADRCRGKLSERRITLKSIAAVLNCSEATIYLKMSGGSEITLSELATIAAACRFTREDVNFIIFGQ